jgi:hypothetical protein
MAIPIQPKDTQAGCSPVSSNCVIWQGPDIPCIELCRGDSISDVTYKIATELCTLLNQLNIANLDVSCFPPISPKPENIQDIIQFILNKLCEIQNITPVTPGLQNCGEAMSCLVPVPTCLQTTDALGNLIVETSIYNYAVLIGNALCSVINGEPVITNTLNTHTKQIETLNTAVFPAGGLTKSVKDSIVVPNSCLSASTNIPIVTFVSTLEDAFCELKSATGSATEITTAIGNECINLDTAPSLNNPTVPMGTLPGWVSSSSYANLSDAITNMWLTICDMRTAVQNIVENCCNPSCDSVDIFMDLSYTNPNLSLAFTGSAVGFSDCFASGMYVTITDAYGVSYTTQVSVIPNLGGAAQVIDLSLSLLNLYTDYTVKLDVCATDGTLTCNKCVTGTVENSALCPTMLYAADVTYIDYSFTNNISSPVTYIVECWNSLLTAIVTTDTIVNPAAGLVTGSLTGLTASTSYKIRVRVIIGSSIKDCDYTTVTTNP